MKFEQAGGNVGEARSCRFYRLFITLHRFMELYIPSICSFIFIIPYINIQGHHTFSVTRPTGSPQAAQASPAIGVPHLGPLGILQSSRIDKRLEKEIINKC